MEAWLSEPLPMEFPWPWNNEHSEAFWEIRSIMSDAESEVRKFRSAIALADYGFHESQRPSDPGAGNDPKTKAHRDITRFWATIAAHSAIDALFQFADTLETMQSWAQKPAAAFCQNPNAAREATEAFNRFFPKWKQTRHATAHSAEIRRNLETNAHKGKMSNPIVSKPKGASVLMTDCFNGRKFMTTRKGELLEFDVTWENYSRLLSVYSILRDGLAPAPSQSKT